MKLSTEIKKKSRSSYPCKECQVDIEIGEQYMAVTYSDGFRKRPFGAYHPDCWKKSPDNPRNKSLETPTNTPQ